MTKLGQVFEVRVHYPLRKRYNSHKNNFRKINEIFEQINESYKIFYFSLRKHSNSPIKNSKRKTNYVLPWKLVVLFRVKQYVLFEYFLYVVKGRFKIFSINSREICIFIIRNWQKCFVIVLFILFTAFW